MGMVEDLRIEEAVQQALGASAEAKAMALVQLAADPEGCRKRITELVDTTKKQDEARAALDQAVEAAKAEQAAAAARLTEVAKCETEFLAWQTAEKARLKQADADARAGEEANAGRAAELAEHAAAIEAKVAAHDAVVAHMRQHLAQLDAAAAPAQEPA
jgi:hypothetical protein